MVKINVKLLQVRADIIYNKTVLTDRTIIPGTWSEPIHIDVPSPSPVPSPSMKPQIDNNDDSDVLSFVYFIIGFGVGLLIMIVLLIVVYALCYKLRDRWYNKNECVSNRYFNNAIPVLLILCYRRIQYVQPMYICYSYLMTGAL